jgi:hypothetical protein
MRRSAICGSLATTLLAAQVAAQAAGGRELPQPRSVTVDRSLGADRAEAMVRAVRFFYAFWDTGDTTFAREAVSERFIDNTLPKGRPQGPAGLAYASRTFRPAVPDLRCTAARLKISWWWVTRPLPA